MTRESFATYVAALVERKQILDTDRRNPAVNDFVRSWPDGWDHAWRTINPITFVQTVFPFYDSASLMRTEGIPLVFLDPERVIGEPSKGARQYYSSADKASLLHRTHTQILEALCRPPRQAPSTRLTWESSISSGDYVGAPPQCFEIMPFRLYVAHEGGNRVQIYQEANRLVGYEIVETIIFPDARRLALEESAKGWTLYLDEQKYFSIRYCADILVPMFCAYGVKRRAAASHMPTQPS